MSLNPCYSLTYSPLRQPAEINNNELTPNDPSIQKNSEINNNGLIPNNPSIKRSTEEINNHALTTISKNIQKTVALTVPNNNELTPNNLSIQKSAEKINDHALTTKNNQNTQKKTTVLAAPIPAKSSRKFRNKQKLIGRVALGALALLTVIGSGLSANFFWLGQSTSNRPAPGNLDNTCPINDICPNSFSFKGNMSCDLFDYNTLQLNMKPPLTPFEKERQKREKEVERLLQGYRDDLQKFVDESLQRVPQELQKMSQESIQRSQKHISTSLDRKQALETNIDQWKLEIAEMQREISDLSSGETLKSLVNYNPKLEDEIEIIPTNTIPAEGDIITADKLRMKIVARDFQGEGILLFKKKVYRDEYSRTQLLEFLTDQGFEIRELGYTEGITAQMDGKKMTVCRDSSHADMWYFSMPWKGGTPLPSVDFGVFHSNLDINEANIFHLESKIFACNRKIKGAEDEIKDQEDRIKREEAEIAFNQKSLGNIGLKN